MTAGKKRSRRPRKIRLSVDANLLGRDLVPALRHIAHVSLADPKAKDPEVIQHANQDDRHILTRDKLDFVRLLRHGPTIRIGVIRLSRSNPLMTQRLRWFLRTVVAGHDALYGRVATLDAEAYIIEDKTGATIVPRTKWPAKT